MADGRFLFFFAARSSAEAYLRTSPLRGHSTVGFPKRCGDFVAIWLRAREEFADNRFQLLFIRQHGSAVYVGMVVVVCIP